ncbi:acyltransferase family protein [Tropicibacter naphthalenivorans]|uniref:O-acetyltransferase OatA n=1 Tax=Tropicibacter naphthalenivorans TaxID=441103 RepID=A0A0P1GDS1_9RHOB|nr:acyltransferase family protein [Tropicibacter naphthalenivorans]CUH79399.1 O-acetyltransferase OatA [Tropicibacter naphthalenivorans]SMC71921.1 Peptidoglycan/LPS O-acetylase OafA/YrhL, contains acyltransferase and SGNH-hydrolase domains [Tropicibacter naphthalenivorans]
MSAAPHAPLPYRRDIDGLRAIAVLSVVLYHFGFPLRGGFVGVDIFFVISGFLIGGILWREYDATGTIWLKHFYIRRFKRLAPAFFTMVAVTAAVGWLILLPFEYREFGKSVIAATVYLSNVLFFREAGYFDSASEEKPLLHTWSLAVEEQFYVFLPLFILLLARWRWGLVGALVAVWAGSLAACIWLTPISPTSTFYLFPFRAWEMLSGVLLAIWGVYANSQWRGHSVLSYLGLALIAISLAFIPAGPLFPGVLAVFPVLGTVLLLSSGAGDNYVNRLLTHRAAVFFGLISYSLYLWHWPVVTLSSYLRGGYANFGEALIWMALSIGLGWLSWRVVETPVRHARRLPGGAVLAGTAVLSLGALAVGAVLFKGDGLPSRFGPETRVHVDASGDFLQDFSRCYIADTLPLDGLEVCPIGPDGPPRVLVWGDSHVRAFKEGLDLAAHEANTPGIILWRAGCPPLFDIRKVESAATPAQDTACTQANLQIKQALPRLDTLDTVLLIGRWAYYANGKGVGRDVHNTIALHPTTGPTKSNAKPSRLMADAAVTTVVELRNWVDNVVVLRQPPELPEYDSRSAAREAAFAGWPLAPAPTVQDSVAQDSLIMRSIVGDAPWRIWADRGAITFIDTWPKFCADGTCHAIVDGVGQYFDNNHLTNAASLRVRDLFAPVFGGTAIRTGTSE